MKRSIFSRGVKALFVLLFSSLFTDVYCQTKVVRGYVTTFTDLPVGNVEIVAKKARSSILSSPEDGSFTIVCNDKDVLEFRGKVFKKRKVKIGKQDNAELSVRLEFIQSEENIEYAVGYGYISDRDKLNAAARTYNEQGFCNYSNMDELIRSRFPGITINSSDCFLIRGISSITSSSCALLILNGQEVSSISHVAPCDVKSIDMIKDSGSAIYGARGANGVIIVTLK